MRLTTGLWGLLLPLTGTAGAADLYKWKDANGVTHYSESPPSGQKFEARRIDARGTVGLSEEETPAAREPPRCTQARQNLKALSDSRPVMEDTDGDGKTRCQARRKPARSAAQLADAAVKAFCPQTGG